jgi:putative transposase
MPRSARIVGVGHPHHVVQRGNNREKVFWDKEDYLNYLSLLENYSCERAASVLAYCLMPNHIHLLVKPTIESSLPKMMQGISLCYTQYLNRKNRRTGRLWECRYHSSIVEEDRYLWAVTSYIENNPPRAGIAVRPEEYPYSSAKAHILGHGDPLLKEPLFDRTQMSEYKNFIIRKVDEGILEEIRKRTRLGRPLGEEAFLKNLSRELGNTLTFRSRGRPRKQVTD